jgi:DNA-binding SARP family transcriptional activator
VSDSPHPRPGGARARPDGARPRTPLPYRAVFEFFPSGIVVVDAEGAVQGTNLMAKRMLRELLDRPQLRCCDLFDCGRTDGPLAGRCLTEVALEHQGPMPEVRVDLPAPAGARRSVWVTGTPFGGAEPAVVLQLRPGVVGDRRRRTEPHWIGGPQLRVFTFGRTRVEGGAGPLGGDWVGHRPGQVFKYLITHRTRVVQTEELIETFWPSAGPRGVASVRQAMHTLRQRLEPERARHAGSAFVAARFGGYELERDGIWIDVDDFELSAREGLKALATGDDETAEAALTRAVGLYAGDFLAEEPYAEWALDERERLRDLAGQALRGLAGIREAAGDLEGATKHLQRLADLQPYDMDVQRDLLALLLRRGRHADAVRRFDVVRHRHRKVFNEDPGFDLAELAASVGPG